MTDLIRAKELLAAGEHTCVLCRGEQTLTSDLRGVAPLVEWLTAGVDLSGYSAADKVVGKATAFLYVLAGVVAVHAPVVSDAAAQVLEQHGVALTFGQRVRAIRNRAGTGRCPMESAVQNITDPNEALGVIRETLHALRAAGSK